MALLRSFRASNLNSVWFCWPGSSKGKYSVSSFGKFFYWLVVQNRILVKVELVKRGVSSIIDPSCPLCGNMFETVSHLLFNCDISCLAFPKSPISFLHAWDGG
ncbi:hypothetical protein V6N12_064860 [Hibiscus sabdariffa]|uniref:Reverse transcriptase zinc-binding domain-containing protein n=1 Tax=Hibiscus sabdariffa TaxID=183260 RepID=A0ABR2G784_9ROSI